MSTRQASKDIKESIRKDIVLLSSTEDAVLHEGKLAERFGVSRTPIRQVLQSLQAERLVAVRSGVGTVVTPLAEDRRDADQLAFSTILLACADTAVREWPAEVDIAFKTATLMLTDASQADDLGTYYHAASLFLGGLEQLCSDEILIEALKATHWRYVRRRVERNRHESERLCAELNLILKTASAGVGEKRPGMVLTSVSQVVKDLMV